MIRKNKYVTFHTEVFGRTPIKVYYYAVCNNADQAKQVVTDLYSIDGVKYIRVANKINTKGRKQIPMDLWDSNINEFKNYKWLE